MARGGAPSKQVCPRCKKPFGQHEEGEEFACRVLQRMLESAHEEDGALVLDFTEEMTADALAAMGEHRQMPGEPD